MESLAYDTAVHSAHETAASAAPASRASNRSSFLQRLLLGADLLSAAAGGLIAALVFGVSLGDAAIMSVDPDGGLDPARLRLRPLQRRRPARLGQRALRRAADRRRRPAARLAGAGDRRTARRRPPDLFALVATFATVSIDSVARALGRGYAHRVAPLRQRTVLVGSGVVADRLADRLDRHGEFGLETIGLVDDDVHTLNGAAAPAEAGLARPARRGARGVRRRPRHHRLLPRQPPAAAQLHPHLPRPPRRGRRRAPSLRAARRRPGDDPDRRPAADLDRRATADPHLARRQARPRHRPLGAAPGRPQPAAAGDRDRDQARLARARSSSARYAPAAARRPSG